MRVFIPGVLPCYQTDVTLFSEEISESHKYHLLAQNLSP